MATTKLQVQSAEGAFLGSFGTWQFERAENWSLPKEVIQEALNLRNCCSGQITGKVVALDARDGVLNEVFFSSHLGFCEAFCCGDISATSFFNLAEEIKMAGKTCLEKSGTHLESGSLHIGDAPKLSSYALSAQDFIRDDDSMTRSNDPTPPTSRPNSRKATPPPSIRNKTPPVTRQIGRPVSPLPYQSPATQEAELQELAAPLNQGQLEDEQF